MNNLGLKIMLLRKSRRLTQTEFGKIIEKSHKTVSCYEKGTFKPNIKTLMTIANYFNVSIDEFTKGSK